MSVLMDLLNKAVQHVKSGNFEEALHFYQEAKNQNPDDIRSKYNIWICLKSLNKNIDADLLRS